MQKGVTASVVVASMALALLFVTPVIGRYSATAKSALQERDEALGRAQAAEAQAASLRGSLAAMERTLKEADHRLEMAAADIVAAKSLGGSFRQRWQACEAVVTPGFEQPGFSRRSARGSAPAF